MQIDILDAIKQIAKCNNVNFTIYKNGDEIPKFDMGLRRGMIAEDELKKTLDWLLKNCKEGTIYFGSDFFATEYCIALIPEKERQYGELLLIGPYLNELIDEAKFNEMMNSESVPMECRTELAEYYRAVPIIKNCDQWREMCKSFLGILYGGKAMQVKYLEHSAWDIDYLHNNQEDTISQELIEERYITENNLIRAVSDGNLDEAMRYRMQSQKYRIARRYESPVRDMRNGAVITNTLMRKAVELGGVHPVHIDKLSTQFAKKIETVSTSNEYDHLMNEMIRKYCLLVQNHSMSGYSPVIQKVANYININLTEDLSLSALATRYTVSASYLSTLFKKEMGVTITEYANQQRIRRAVALLNTTNLHIQDIASECGIYDASYFRKLFKKYVGQTPSDYIKNIRNE